MLLYSKDTLLSYNRGMPQDKCNKIEIRTAIADGVSIYARAGIGIQILIDGIVYTDGEDYYVDIDR